MHNLTTSDHTPTGAQPSETPAHSAAVDTAPAPSPAAPTVESFLDDLPLPLALSAFSGVSHYPERRAENTRKQYAAEMFEDFQNLAKYAATSAQLLMLDTEFHRFRTRYAAKYRAYLASSARCVSWFIAGPSNFPAARMNKRADFAHTRLTDLIEFRKRALAAIAKTLNPHPELRPIMAGDPDALERLASEIAEARSKQERMRDANAAIRKHFKAGNERVTAALVLLGFSREDAAQLLNPNSITGIGFPSYKLTNNGANIRRMEKRFAALSAAKSQKTMTLEGIHARLEDCPPDNRVRLFFPGKPAVDVRDALKQAGFRWAPTLHCWQAYRNHGSRVAAIRFAGIPAKPAATQAA